MATSMDYLNQMLGGTKKDIQHLELKHLIPFENQPFKPYTEARLQELAEDIRENGVMSPILVREQMNGYQILAGHNRVAACRLAGLETIPALLKDVDDDMAMLIMLNTNLNQRDELRPSEKAFAYKMQMDTMKRQGQRNDLVTNGHKDNENDLVTNGHKVDSAFELSEKVKENKRQIFRYVRLTFLIQDLLDMVDNGEVPFVSGVNISYLGHGKQESLYSYLLDNQIKTITVAQSEAIKAYSKSVELTSSNLDGIFGKKEKKEPSLASHTVKTLNKFFVQKIGDRVVTEELLLAVEKTIDDFYKEVQ